MKALLPGQKTERKVFNSSNWSWRTGFCLFYNVPFKNMKSMMTQCLQIAHEQGRKMDSELEAECLKTVFNCDYFWSKWNITNDRLDRIENQVTWLMKSNSSESHIMRLVSSMLVTDVGDQMCWWQSWDAGDRFRMLVIDLIHWENHQHKLCIWCASFCGHWNSKDI